MEFLEEIATIVFVKLIDSLFGGEHRKIENDPFMPLTIERIGENLKTAYGNAQQYSLCHYYEQNGDLMQDPEMCFFVFDERNGLTTDYDKVKIAPYLFRQASSGTYQESVFRINETVTTFHMTYQREQTDFANIWLTNIEQQGFLNHLL